MTEQNLHVALLPHGWRAALDQYLAERAHGMNGYLITRQRLASIAQMHSLSDAELAEMGLRRADIPAFVFEDVFPEP